MRHLIYRINLPLDLTGARAVHDELVPFGRREADLDHELAIHHDVHFAVQTQPRGVKRIVLARCLPAGIARGRGIGSILVGGVCSGGADSSGMHRQRCDGQQGGESVSGHDVLM